MMVFFDTCIWIELCCTTTPGDGTQAIRAQKASSLLTNIRNDSKQIVTCKEQLLEIISAIQKIKMREYNKNCKANSITGVGQLKEYRNTSDFASAQALCSQAVSDVCRLATETTIGEFSINDILSNIHLVDINDYLYYQYCTAQGIDFYTFDNDFTKLAAAPEVHII